MKASAVSCTVHTYSPSLENSLFQQADKPPLFWNVFPNDDDVCGNTKKPQRIDLCFSKNVG
jgi:hypothetical protein